MGFTAEVGCLRCGILAIGGIQEGPSESWGIHGGSMGNPWWIHGGFMRDPWGIHEGSMGDPWGIHRNPSFETHQDPSGIDRGLIGDPLRTISMGIDRNDASTLLPDDARLQFEFQMTHEPTHCCPRMSTGKEGQPPSLRNTAEMLPRVTFSRTRMT